MSDLKPSDHWLVRDSKNFIWGPVSRAEVIQLIRDRKLKPRTEISHSLSYWFSIEENREMVNFFPELADIYGDHPEHEPTQATIASNTKTIPGEWLNDEYAAEFGYIVSESSDGTTVAKVRPQKSEYLEPQDEPTLVPYERGTDPTIPVENNIREFQARQNRKKFLIFTGIVIAILAILFALTFVEHRMGAKKKIGNQVMQLGASAGIETGVEAQLSSLRASILLGDLSGLQEAIVDLESKIDSIKLTAEANRMQAYVNLAKAVMRKEFLVDSVGAISTLNDLKLTNHSDPRMRNEIDNLLAIYKLDSEPEESVKILKKVSESLPNDTVVQFNYGMALISAGQVDKAKEEFKSLLGRLEPNDRLMSRVKISIARLDDKVAEENLMAALAVDPYLSEAQILLALVHWKSGKRVKGEAFIRRFIDSLPIYRDALYVKNFRLAESELVYNSIRTEVRTLLARISQPDDLLLSLDGILSLLVGEYRGAEQAFDRALQVTPGSIFALKGMAYLRMREGRDFEIEGLIKSKTEQNRDSFAFNVLLAQSYFKQGKLAEASTLYKALIETDPKLSLGYSLAGEIDRQQNRAEVAMQNFQKALELNPMDITALRGLSQLGRGDRVNALLLQSLIPF